jgi:hypothetical protein
VAVAEVPGPEVSAAARLWPSRWLGCALAWLPVLLVEMISIPNQWLLVFLVPPVELVLWLVAGWRTLRLLTRTGSGRLARAATLLAFSVVCVHFTNWGVFHPSSYYATHRYAFAAVAAGLRDGSVGSTDDYYGRALPWYQRDLSTLATAAVVGEQDGRPVVFLPQWLGIPDDAAGYVFLDRAPEPGLTVDLFGAQVQQPLVPQVARVVTRSVSADALAPSRIG